MCTVKEEQAMPSEMTKKKEFSFEIPWKLLSSRDTWRRPKSTTAKNKNEDQNISQNVNRDNSCQEFRQKCKLNLLQIFGVTNSKIKSKGDGYKIFGVTQSKVNTKNDGYKIFGATHGKINSYEKDDRTIFFFFLVVHLIQGPRAIERVLLTEVVPWTWEEEVRNAHYENM